MSDVLMRMVPALALAPEDESAQARNRAGRVPHLRVGEGVGGEVSLLRELGEHLESA